MTLYDLKPRGYLLDPNTVKPFGQMTATEVLSYFINNILVFEKTIFASLQDAVLRFKDVLDLSDREWLYNFFTQKVYIVDNNITEFHWKNAIGMKVVCEILLYDKYTPREAGLEEMPVPQLPDPNDELDIGYLNIYFRRHIDERITQYQKIIDYYEQFRIS